DQAEDIKAQVDKMSKTLAVINEKIASSQDAAKGNPDVALAAELAGLELKKPETDKLFKTNYYYMEDLVIDRLFNYYNDTMILYNIINQHGKKTENDKDAIESFIKSGAGKGDKNYAVTLDLSGAIPLAHFAEIGGPV